MRRPLSFAVAATAGLVLTACAPQSSDNGSSASGGASGNSASQNCSPKNLKTLKANTLTIATDQPAFEPWMVDDDPTNGKGFESAVAYAVADQLGYSKDQVTWTR